MKTITSASNLRLGVYKGLEIIIKSNPKSNQIKFKPDLVDTPPAGIYNIKQSFTLKVVKDRSRRYSFSESRCCWKPVKSIAERRSGAVRLNI